MRSGKSEEVGEEEDGDGLRCVRYAESNFPVHSLGDESARESASVVWISDGSAARPRPPVRTWMDGVCRAKLSSGRKIAAHAKLPLFFDLEPETLLTFAFFPVDMRAKDLESPRASVSPAVSCRSCVSNAVPGSDLFTLSR